MRGWGVSTPRVWASVARDETVGARSCIATACSGALCHSSRVVGIDTSFEMLAIAREKFRAARLPGSWVYGSAESLPLRSASADLAVAVATPTESRPGSAPPSRPPPPSPTRPRGSSCSFRSTSLLSVSRGSSFYARGRSLHLLARTGLADPDPAIRKRMRSTTLRSGRFQEGRRTRPGWRSICGFVQRKPTTRTFHRMKCFSIFIGMK
ncbi:MAG: class I SAM-dependent methyltransferase [Nitrospirota bacterium]